MSDNFVHLHAHTSIGSMQDAMTSVSAMFERAKEFGQPALAITDHGTMAAVFDARKAAKKTGVKYIPGMEAYVIDDLKSEKKQKRRHLVLLAKNEIGYRNLLRMNYEGFTHSTYVAILNKVFPQIDWDLIEKYSEGIICLTACGSGPLSYELLKYEENGEKDSDACHVRILKTAGRLKKIFRDDLYLEVQPHSLLKHKLNRKTGEVECTPSGEPIIVVDQESLNRKLMCISKELNISLVATCDVHYLDKEDAKAHDMLMAINDKKPISDPNRHRYDVEEFYMKQSGEVVNHFTELFSRKVALELCNTTVDIANKCEDSAYIDTEDIRFPLFMAQDEADYEKFQQWRQEQSNEDVPEDHAFMRYRCIEAFKKKYKHLDKATKRIYKQRLIDEIKVLEYHNFSSYMMITSDFIKKAKEHGIPVGPGRGSVGGCLVANLLDIHEVDPIQYGLLFERFHNKEKTSFPDIDTDFSPDGRDWVEQYIVNKYGKSNVAHVSNLSTMTLKVVVKDVARSLCLGGDKSEAFKIANSITDVIPDDAKSFDDALQGSEKFREFCAKYPDVEKYGRKLVGLEKTYATHAAGIVVSDIDLSTYVPLRYDKEGTVSVQYEKNRCESMGLIKMDLLGLEHLKVIKSTIDNVQQLGQECKLPEQLAPFDDKGVWDMISRGQTICVFQMGSPHMRNLCKRIRPRNIEDLALVNALGRPSAEKSREAYMARRDGREKVTLKYPCLEPLLETLGICVYEEQMLKLAKSVSGWDLNKADGLRKLTKLKGKNPALAEKLKQDFIQDGMVHSGLKKIEVTDIWENIIEPFAGYGFNKAHAIFYSLNGYHTAYYKHHHRAPFMASVLKSEVEKSTSNEEKIKIYKKEAKRMGIKIQAPDVNRSGEYFSVLDDQTIVMGLAAVKGVGAKAVQNIITTRDEHEFVSYPDFLYRTGSHIVKKNVIQALAKAGCFDSLSVTRKDAHEFYSAIRTRANKHAEKNATKGMDAWHLLDDFYCHEIAALSGMGQEWDKKAVVQGEGETLGEYISGGYNDLFDGFFTNNGLPLKRLKKLADNTPVRVEVIVDAVTQSKTKNGKNRGNIYGTCTVTDLNKDSATMKIWSNKWNSVKEQIKVGRPIRAICKVNVYKGTHALILDKLEAMME